MTEPTAPVGVGGSVDAADIDAVLRARQLRRRLRLMARVFRVLLMISVFGTCGFAFIVPSLTSFPCRSAQSEAKGNLKSLYVAEESYRAEFDSYSDDVNKIGFAARGSNFRYVITDVTANRFQGWAFRTDGRHDDVWSISQQNDLQNLIDGCEE